MWDNTYNLSDVHEVIAQLKAEGDHELAGLISRTIQADKDGLAWANVLISLGHLVNESGE